jgi:hypothetical protein
MNSRPTPVATHLLDVGWRLVGAAMVVVFMVFIGWPFAGRRVPRI